MSDLPVLHPYEVPEIVVLDPTHVHGDYARWVNTECNAVKPD